IIGTPVAAEEKEIHEERKALFLKIEALTHIPWYYFAAIDNYERNKKQTEEDEKVISIAFSDEEWFGIENYLNNPDPSIIDLFNGIGKDGNGDGVASPDQDEDILYT